MIAVIDIVTSLLLTALNYFLLCNYLSGEKWNSFAPEHLKINRGRCLYLIFAVVLFGVETVVFQTVYEFDLLTQLKLIVLSAVMLPCAAVDYKIQKIPNIFLLEGLILRVILLCAEFLVSADRAANAIKNDLLGAAVCGGFFLLMLLVFKNSIGMGDIKLFAMIGLFKGLWGAIGSVFLSLCVSFVVSVVLLISKRKTRNDTIPFGPCIFIGTTLSNCLFGM